MGTCNYLYRGDCFRNGLNPYLFQQLPNMDMTDENALDQLLPWSTNLPVSCITFNQLYTLNPHLTYRWGLFAVYHK